MGVHELDYVIYGDDMQFVEIELDPGETVLSEAGAMMYMTGSVRMDADLDSSGGKGGSGLLDSLIAAGKRYITGESLFLAAFSHRGSAGRERVAFAAPYPGKIIPLNLADLGAMLCQKDSYLCSALGVDICVAFTRRIGAGLFGGEGFILQRLSGGGYAFVHAGGTVRELTLLEGQSLRVDTGCIVAFQERVDYDIEFVGNIKSALFAGEGMFLAKLTGPGKVYLQSIPFSRLADRIYKAMPQTGGRRREEGGIFGNFLMGNRR